MYSILQNRRQHLSWSLHADQRRVSWADSAKKGSQAEKGTCHLNQTSATIRASLVVVTDWRLFLKGSSTTQGFYVSSQLDPGWGAIRSMSLKFLASHTLAAESQIENRVPLEVIPVDAKAVDALKPVSQCCLEFVELHLLRPQQSRQPHWKP